MTTKFTIECCTVCMGEKVVWRGGQGGDYEPCQCVAQEEWPLSVPSVHDRPQRPSDAELSAVVTEAIEAWKKAREMPYLSPSACKQLNDLIVAGLRPVLGRQP